VGKAGNADTPHRAKRNRQAFQTPSHKERRPLGGDNSKRGRWLGCAGLTKDSILQERSIMAEKQKVVEGAMTEQEREFLRWFLDITTILEEIMETAQAEQTEPRKTGPEMRAEIKRQLHDLSLEQLLSVARFVRVPEKQIREDLAGATTIAV
jgi:hypothetical protein